MVDFDFELKKLHPINIKELELSSYAIDEDIKKSIILYNSAVGEIKKGNYELVIDDLKKALSYNEGFTEAVKLMGLCYVKMKEYKKAERIFKKLSKYLMDNELSDEYIKGLDLLRSMPEAITVDEAARNISNKKNRRSIKSGHLKRNLAICLFIIIAGTGLNYFYPETVKGALNKVKASIQEKFQSNNKEVVSKEETNESLNEAKTSTDEKPNEDTGLKAKIVSSNPSNEKQDNGQKNTDNTKSEIENYNKTTANMLSDAEKLLNSESYEKAATILIDAKNRNLNNESKIKLNELWQRLKPNPMWKIYNDGNTLYKQNKYSEALPKLLITAEIEPNLDIAPWVNYQIAMCYKQTNDYDNARIYFNKVKNNYPKSQYASYSKATLNEIGN
ncbi:tetratricopeptide repeat protein [Clostridium sp. C2-6-12]|uniref:tetratricopeptide repeat protein n=1 Tax=Clostridium sp. C2-6-12 TaxID=2698832 RepID=UPI00136D5907|nr:tetratricopeptide repeat protein [Clostridium sp. C2-6-12]